jgi:hypothetical protein
MDGYPNRFLRRAALAAEAVVATSARLLADFIETIAPTTAKVNLRALRTLAAAAGLMAVIVFADVSQAATTTVGLEAETFTLQTGTASVVSNPNALGGKAMKLSESGTEVIRNATTSTISRISLRARSSPGSCASHVEVLYQLRQTDGTYTPATSIGKRSFRPSYGWAEFAGFSIPAGEKRLIVRQSCTAPMWFDYLDYNHEEGVPPPPESPPPGGTTGGDSTSKAIVGVYEGWHDAAGVNSFYSWLGYTGGEQYAHEFVDHRYGWSAIGDCAWNGWIDWVAADDVKRRLTISLPLMPATHAGQFEAVGRGDFDSYFRQCANSVNGTAADDMIIRLGWEMNGNTFPWRVDVDGGAGAATDAEVANYKAAYRHVVQVMNAANPELQFEWEPNVTLDDAGRSLEDLYPGDDVTDYIGLAVYDYNICGFPNTVDGRWNCLQDPIANRADDNGMIHHASFAAAHNKPMTFTEYGLWTTTRSPGGGGDNPIFINRMADWIQSHRVAYQIYNEGHSDHSLNNYPNSKVAYQLRFGS